MAFYLLNSVAVGEGPRRICAMAVALGGEFPSSGRKRARGREIDIFPPIR
jgi:hypothetical protein